MRSTRILSEASKPAIYKLRSTGLSWGEITRGRRVTRSGNKLYRDWQPDPRPPVDWRRLAAAACWIAAIVFAYLSVADGPI